MSDCSTNAFQPVKPIKGQIVWKGGMMPTPLDYARYVNGVERVADHIDFDGERYERVVERAPEWDGQWFRCGACGGSLDRFGVRTTQMPDGTTVRRIAEPPKRCPECGARVKEGGDEL